VTFLLTAGQCHESTVFERLMEQGAVKRVGAGRARVRPQRVAADKAGTTDSDLLTKDGDRGGHSPTENTSLAGGRASIALPTESGIGLSER
jgi:hypothetical protein